MHYAIEDRRTKPAQHIMVLSRFRPKYTLFAHRLVFRLMEAKREAPLRRQAYKSNVLKNKAKEHYSDAL